MTPITAPQFDFKQGGTKLCIVKPDVGLSTPEVFKALKYDELSDADPEELLKRFVEDGVIIKGGGEEGEDKYVNDLEGPAFRCLPELGRLKVELMDERWGFDTVMMSGSGTSIFCMGEPNDADEFRRTFIDDRDGLSVFFADFISREGEDGWFQRR